MQPPQPLGSNDRNIRHDVSRGQTADWLRLGRPDKIGDDLFDDALVELN